MLRVLLGGIAGIVTGYALKKYLDEEECYSTHYDKDHEDEVDESNIQQSTPESTENEQMKEV